MLTTVKLHGFLGKKYGKTFKLAADSPRKAIALLRANFKEFTKDVVEHQPGFRIIVGKETIEEDGLIRRSGNNCIRIVPVIAGSGNAGRIILGIVLIVVGVFTTIAGDYSGSLIQLGFGLVLGGVAGLLFPVKPYKPSEAESAVNRPSSFFNGAVNTTGQGNPVPVLYGHMLVGSQVISAGLSTEQVA